MTDLDEFLSPLHSIDPGAAPPVARRAAVVRHRPAFIAAATALVTASAIAIPVLRSGDSAPGVLDVLGRASAAAAVPADRADRVHYLSSLVTSQFELRCAGADVVGNPTSERRAQPIESWDHAESGQRRVRYTDARGAYDWVETIVGQESENVLLVDSEGTLPEPPDGRGCDFGTVAAGDIGPTWENAEQEAIVAALRAGGGVSGLDPAGNVSARAEIFADLAAVDGAELVSTPAVDALGRPVMSVRIDLVGADEEFTGIWRFDPDTYVLREFESTESNPMLFSHAVSTIVVEAWLPLGSAVFDHEADPPTS